MTTRTMRKIAALVVAAAAGTIAATRGRASTTKSANDAIPAPASAAPLAKTASLDTAVFAGGCFWGVEGVYEHVKGVTKAISGYAGGTLVSPGYEDVSSGETGHAESVEVIYDPSQVSYGQLLQVFFGVAHDPTEVNRQGPDVGTQYRSAIFYRNETQHREAAAYIAQLAAAKVYAKPIATEVSPLKAFYVAESYHQGYMAAHPDQPYIVYNDAPKLVHLKHEYPALYRAPAKA